jgi:hypothetical protein
MQATPSMGTSVGASAAAVLGLALATGCSSTCTSTESTTGQLQPPCTTIPDKTTSGFVWLDLPQSKDPRQGLLCKLVRPRLPGISVEGLLFSCGEAGFRTVAAEGTLEIPDAPRMGSTLLDATQISLVLGGSPIWAMGDHLVRIAPGTKTTLERWTPPRVESWSPLETALPDVEIMALSVAREGDTCDIWVLQKDDVLRYGRSDGDCSIPDAFVEAQSVTALPLGGGERATAPFALLVALGDGTAAVAHYAQQTLDVFLVSSDGTAPRPMAIPAELADIAPKASEGGGLAGPRLPRLGRVGPHALMGRDEHLAALRSDGAVVTWTLPSGVLLADLAITPAIAPEGTVGLAGRTASGEPTPLLCSHRVCESLALATCDLPLVGGRLPALLGMQHLAPNRWLLLFENGAAFVGHR